MKIFILSFLIIINKSILLDNSTVTKKTRKLAKISELPFSDIIALVKKAFDTNSFKENYVFEEINE